MKNTIIENAIALANTGKENGFEAAQTILLEHLKLHPQDTQAWLLLIRIECNTPFDDAERITDYAQHILAYDPLNVYALLFLVYADYYTFGGSNQEIYQKLCKLSVKDKKLMAIIEIAKAFYLEYTDHQAYEKILKKSIEYYPLLSNLRRLGDLYTEQGKLPEAQFFLNEVEERCKILEPQWIERSKIPQYASLDYFLNSVFGQE